MKRHVVVLCSLMSIGVVNAQEVVSTQGDSYSNSNGSIDFTIGEVVINTVSDGSNDLTQGFHQTNWNFAGLEDHSPFFEAKVYPNPMSESLIVEIAQFENVSYQMIDASGRLVIENQLSDVETSIQTGQLEPGAYQLILKNQDQLLKTFKLLKNQ